MSALASNCPFPPIEAYAFPALRGKKLLFVIDEMAAITAGGTERQLLQLVDITRRAGLAPEILVLRATRWLTQEIAGCPVHHRSLGAILRPHGLHELMSIVRWMRERRFDVVQSFFFDANVLTPFLARAAGVKCVLTSRRNLNYAITPFRLIAQRVANRFTTDIVANCEAVRDVAVEMEKVDARKVHVIYNGIDLSAFAPCVVTRARVRAELGVGPNEVLIGCVSAVRPIKGVHHLVGAARYVAERVPNARFCVVGDGEDVEPLMNITLSNRALRERFQWLGAREEVRPYLCAFDIAVLPSLSEGFSNSVLEYMAMGVPTVATDVGGNREMLEPGAGLLVRPGDEQQLASALERLATEPSLREAISRRGLQRVKLWDLSFALENNGRYYSRLLRS